MGWLIVPGTVALCCLVASLQAHLLTTDDRGKKAGANNYLVGLAAVLGASFFTKLYLDWWPKVDSRAIWIGTLIGFAPIALGYAGTLGRIPYLLIVLALTSLVGMVASLMYVHL